MRCPALRAATLIVVACLGLSAAQAESTVSLPDQVAPLLKQYCFDCHNPDKQKGDVNLVEAAQNAKLGENRETWEKVLDAMEKGDMPPEKKPQPTGEERELVVHFLDNQLAQLDAGQGRNPGHVTIRRLNREEYRHTIRDLLQVDFNPDDFPNDDVGYGFDNIGDVLTISPMLMEKYLAAAETIATKAIVTGGVAKGSVEHSLPASHRALITKMPSPGEEHAVALELLRPLVKRAYRRAVEEGEVERIARFVDLALEQKSTFLEGMQLALEAILCSPQFLFRTELDPGALPGGAVRELNDYELASRLSYFLWSSMPDQPLFALAEQGALRKDGNLEKQIVRMLADGKAYALVEGFADQWLQIRNLYEVAPDPKLFPRWEDDVKWMFKEETERFFEAVVKEDRSTLDLLDGHFTFLNERLARFYGIPGVTGSEFRRVELPADSPRGGVLTQAAVLICTSTPTRTSPVIRGKWILEQILGTPPPPPPADVPPLGEQSAVNQSLSLRERFSAHAQRAECAGCHKRMDPLGFALENFDATGAWREQDGKFPIDASGKLPDGRTFNGPRELKELLKSGNGFRHTLAEKLMTYALGRGLTSSDRGAIRDVVESTKQQGDRFSALVTAIVLSDPFLKRQTVATLSQN